MSRHLDHQETRRPTLLAGQSALAFAQVGNLALGVLAAGTLARGLSAADFAALTVVGSVLAVLAALVDGGFGAVLIARAARGPDRLVELVARFRVVLAAVATLGAALWFATSGGATVDRTGALAAGLVCLSILSLPLRTAQIRIAAAGLFGRTALVGFLSQAVFAAASIWIYRSGGGAGEAVAALALREFLLSIGSFVVAKTARLGSLESAERPGRPADLLVTRALMMQLAHPVLIAATGACYFHVDVFMLRRLADDQEVSEWGLALRFAQPLFALINGIALPLVPRFARLDAVKGVHSADRRIAAFLAVLGFAAPATLLAVDARGWIALVAGEAAARSGEPFLWLVLGVLPVAIGAAAAHVLIAEGRYADWWRITLLALVVNVLLDLALIPDHGALGAAWATLAVETLVAIAAVRAALRHAGTWRNGPALAGLLAALLPSAAGATLLLCLRFPGRSGLVIALTVMAGAWLATVFGPFGRAARRALDGTPEKETRC